MNVISSSDRRTRLMVEGVGLDGMGLGWQSVASSLGGMTCSAGVPGDLELSFRRR